MDILADPDNPDHWPLKLKVFKSEIRTRSYEENKKIQPPHPHDSTGLLCRFYCIKFDKYLVSDPLGENEKPLPKEELDKITTLDTCYECSKEEIIDGVIYHYYNDKIKYFFVDREIAVMYPLELRDEKMERSFITRYKDECLELGITEPYSE